jgi:alkylhydroperoxidase family enzyme
MARVAMGPAEPADPILRPILEEMRAARGPSFTLPHLYRVIGLSPPMLRAWVDFAWPLRLQATSSRRTRELLILRGAQLTKTAYEWTHHVPLALQSGVTQPQIDALGDWQGSPLFSEAERAALRLADEMTAGPATAECVETLKRYFSEAEVVELVLTASFYVCVSRFLKSMDVTLEPGFEALRPKELS